jgi:VanZ family protein
VSDERRLRRNRVHALLLAILVCFWTAMFAGTHVPHLPLEAFPANFDKLLHGSANCGLAFLIAVWLSAGRRVGPKELGGIFGVVFAYAIFDELSQIPVGRDCEFFDAVADCAGGVTGLAAFVTLRSAAQRLAAVRSSSRDRALPACDSTAEVASVY